MRINDSIKDKIIKEIKDQNLWTEKPKNAQEVEMLPTIDKIKKILKDFEDKNPVTRCDYPDIKVDNEDKFIVTKTCRCYSFKPNITNKWFLYRGENEFHEPCTANLYRSQPDYLATNLRNDEFKILLDSHPMIKLFKKGIPLDSKIKLQIDNPYGLAQHYYLKTSLLDLTSDIDVAIFFAVTDYNVTTDTYSIHKSESNNYGVLYVYCLIAPFSSLSLTGLGTIGLQPFLRPARQKGFAQDLHKFKDFNENYFLIKLFFKHDKNIAKTFFNNMNNGKYLFPNDELEEMGKDIRTTPNLSMEAFQKNFKENPNDDPRDNMNKLCSAGINISPDIKPHLFTKDNLETYYNRINNGAWEDFCNSLVIKNNKNENELYIDKLIKIKDDDKYAQYFKR